MTHANVDLDPGAYDDQATAIQSYEIDPDQVKFLDDADKHIEQLKNVAIRRMQLLDQTTQAKKDVMAGWREVLKVQKEQLTEAMEKLSVMEDRRKILAAE
jgi:hypothetical protein